ncbi:MAG: response regulator transcription factor [Ignavibacteriae bacterium]|nr:response regulator transcription factor [Ignavibacteriota bacterium]
MAQNYLIIEDHLMLSSLIEKQLEQIQDIGEIHRVKNGAEALKCFKTNYIDFVLLDLLLPDMEGIHLIPKFKEINSNVKIIIISAESDIAKIKNVAKLGIDAYVSKMNNDQQILKAIQSVKNNKRFISDDILELLFNYDSLEVTPQKSLQKFLTKREVEILHYIAEEMTSKQIADLLLISRHTVETHKRRMMQKLKVTNTAGLIKVAYDKQLLK